jgi:integrase
MICHEWKQAAKRASEGRLTEQQARIILSDLVEAVTGKAIEFHSIAESFNNWLEGREGSIGDGTLKAYQGVISRFLKYLGDRSNLHLEHLSLKDLIDYRKSLQADEITSRRCNYHLGIISTCLREACNHGLIRYNPATAVTKLDEDKVTKEVFTTQQIAALLNASPSADWRNAILLAYYTGARLGDVANLTWEKVDLSKKTIKYKPKKVKKHNIEPVVPIHPQLEDVLLDIAGSDDPAGPLFPSLAGVRVDGGGLSRQFMRITEAAGIKVTLLRAGKGKGRDVHNLSFNSLRHTFVTEMANHGVPAEVRKELAGHTNDDTHEIYTHLDLQTLRTAVEVVPPIEGLS